MGGEEGLASFDEAEKRRRFNRILIESIYSSMEFGEVVLRFLELRGSIKRDKIADKPEVFASELESLLGDGARIILERIVKNIYSNLNLEYEETAKKSFPESIRDALKKYREKTE
ncbi:hypothetical protein DRO35_03365 [Candidatus Bathyarchaeota archaeon]|nr:MAG: hypothetical protein DRO35_03365 [Candidatus Bathyarchaeota archaeon]